MEDDSHTFGAGGQVTDVSNASGSRFFLSYPGEDGTLVANLVRRVILKDDQANTVFDAQLIYFDILFLARSFASYVLKDAQVISQLGNATHFFSENPETYKYKERSVANLRKAADQLNEAAMILEQMKVAKTVSIGGVAEED